MSKTVRDILPLDLLCARPKVVVPSDEFHRMVAEHIRDMCDAPGAEVIALTWVEREYEIEAA